ncbi:MAG TPA: Bax inhibitor-1/YccA family protein [Ktedonobacterales bacterium]|nr:Bax inhibitor-1/YccA family protein [Ktedonobacterales bacterium]
MNQYPASSYPATWGARALDLGAIMRQVYFWLAAGLVLGFGVAFALGRELLSEGPDGTLVRLFANPIVWIGAIVVYLGIGFAFTPIVRRASIGLGAVLYLLFTVVFGLMISTIFLGYDVASILAAFAVTAGMFAVMSVIGFVTKADLSKFGMILLLALIGLIIASVVNIFLSNSVLYWIVTYAGVLIFCGLTAYDTQWIKRAAAQASVSGSAQTETRIALIGAFRLFLDFVNLFLFILRIFGGGRS